MSNARDRARQQREMAERRKKERRLLIIVGVGLVVVVLVGGILFQAWRTNRAPSAGGGQDGAVTFADVTIENGKPIKLGAADAPVTVTMYEDFHCPHCAEFEEQFGPTITEAQNNGTAVVELYPMAFIDDGSLRAANGMACAAEEGFGQAFYLGLFENPNLQWSTEQLVDLAGQTSGGDTGKFETCVAENTHTQWVESIGEAATANGVESTPSLFVNGDPVEISSLTPETLKTMISEAASQ